MSDTFSGSERGHEELNTAVIRAEAWLERLEKVTERLERMADAQKDANDK